MQLEWKYTSGLLELKDDEKQQIIIPLQFSDMNFWPFTIEILKYNMSFLARWNGLENK